MCSVLIFARPENMALNLTRPWLRPVRGDVIDIQEDDGHFWGNDIAGPDCLGWWRVVVLDGVKRQNVTGLVSADPKPDHDDVPYRKHVFSIDLDALEAEAGNPAKDVALHVTRRRLLDAMRQKPKPVNPFVIGGDPKVIG